MDMMLLLQLFFAVTAIGIATFQWIHQHRQKSNQDKLVDAINGKHYWRVAIGRSDQSRHFLSFNRLPILGVLVDEGDWLRLQALGNTGEPLVDVRLSKTQHPTLNIGADLTGRSWVELHTSAGNWLMGAHIGVQHRNSREMLVDILRSAYPGIQLPSSFGKPFDMAKNKWCVGTMLVMALLAGWAVLETQLWSRYELIDTQLLVLLEDWSLAILGGVSALFGLATYLLLKRRQVPVSEAGGLAILMALAVGIAAIPALKRVDQWTASTGTTMYTYRVLDHSTRLVPKDKQRGLPELRFHQSPEYWSHFKPGQEVQIPLLQGGLGLWQLDHELFDPPVMRFYKQGIKPSTPDPQ